MICSSDTSVSKRKFEQVKESVEQQLKTETEVNPKEECEEQWKKKQRINSTEGKYLNAPQKPIHFRPEVVNCDSGRKKSLKATSSAAFKAFQMKEWNDVAKHFKRYFDILKRIRIRWGRLNTTEKASFKPKEKHVAQLQCDNVESSWQSNEVDASYTELSHE